MIHKEQFDQVDLTLLDILQKNGRIKRGNLAEKVGLTIPSISERMAKLENQGVILGYQAVLNREKIGLDIMAFIFVLSESSTHYQEIIDLAVARDEILECHAITGEGSHLLKVLVRGMHELESLLADIQAWPGVKNTRTDLVLSTAKQTNCISLQHLLRENSTPTV
jgi:Lrp/AsnC family leucine-responsive transcriptional regulator